MITKHSDTYWVNSFGARFQNEQSAKDDETKRTSCPLRILGDTAGDAEFSPPRTEAVGGINGVWGSGNKPHADKHRVVLLKDLITYCQEEIAIHGEGAAWHRVHQGMGHYGERIVHVERNPLFET